MVISTGFNLPVNIKPEKVTKPFQLLGVWLLSLIILVWIFIFASSQSSQIIELRIIYAITSILIIPLFLWLIFKLLTAYRHLMQEDSYYHEWLMASMYLKQRENDVLTGNFKNLEISNKTIKVKKNG